MSTLKVLKEYLVGSDGGYLLNPDNNGKTVMLSGAWGSGKTHFWQNEIEREQKKIQGKTRKVNKYSAKEYKAGLFSKLTNKKKACVYVSLYGKDNIEVLKSEILQKAYSSVKEKNTTPVKRIAAFSIGTKILAGISIFGVKVDAQDISDATKNHYDMKKIDDATKFLSDGGLICLDDFERKSKYIDLNDLFGFIAQLAIDMNCKVVIILNSDVFEGEEANVFKTVKEKTVNKFFYFEPTIEELFESIYSSQEKYKKLDDYKNEILKTIKETEELNARIYIQVLDNCLEWIDKEYEIKLLHVLSLTTINFMLNHILLDYVQIDIESLQHRPDFEGDLEWSDRYGIFYSNLDSLDRILVQIINNISIQEDVYWNGEEHFVDTNFNDSIGYLNCLKQIKDVQFFNIFEDKLNYDQSIKDEMRVHYHNYKDKHKKYILQLWKYGYQLYCLNDIDEEEYTKIANFIKTGILPKKDKEPSS